jgi:hypothetical protein
MQDAQGYVARCTTLSTSSFCLVVWSARIRVRSGTEQMGYADTASNQEE